MNIYLKKTKSKIWTLKRSQKWIFKNIVNLCLQIFYHWILIECIIFIILRCKDIVPLGKNIVKGATQVSGHSLKLHFCVFESHKESIIVWIVIIFLGIFFINYKSYMLKVWPKKFKNFACSKHLNFESGKFFFFQMSLFFYQMCTIPFEN
jgi:hypothetical protein